MAVNNNVWNRIRYTVISPVYDSFVKFGRQRRRSAELLDIQPGEKVLILGAGTGADLPFLPEHAEITAVDITPAMLERLRSRAAGLGRRVDARVMDGQALDLPEGQFDVVILHLILAVIPDPIACIREAERVLRPGGRAVIFDKFLADGDRPSLGRHLLNMVANFVATNINRQLGPILGATALQVEHQEPAGWGGVLQTVVVRKLG
ncbi:MAG TPA: methyltransferase domain-containing protein [Symbiobacteriaceae bacterium]|nr:methyltransferase domain-containing protein [Symbiobacteriaceae bacterium]